MPRLRPRVGKSTTDPDEWNNNPPQGGDFEIKYDSGIEDYQAKFGGGQSVKLLTLLGAKADVAVDGWKGYAQPGELKAKLRAGAGNPPTPSDYNVRWKHKHERWKEISDSTGNPSGSVSDEHTHEGNLADMLVMANDDAGTTRVYVVHNH